MKPTLYMLATLGLLGVAGPQPAPTPLVTPCIYWRVEPGYVANKAQSERMYQAAFLWFQELVPTTPQPCLRVLVGTPCPDPRLNGSCLSVSLKTLYIPQWEPESSGWVFQATIYAAMMGLVAPSDIVSQAQHALNEDTQNFLDYF